VPRDLDHLPRGRTDEGIYDLLKQGQPVELRRDVDWDGDIENARRRYRKGLQRRGYEVVTQTIPPDVIVVQASKQAKVKE